MTKSKLIHKLLTPKHEQYSYVHTYLHDDNYNNQTLNLSNGPKNKPDLQDKTQDTYLAKKKTIIFSQKCSQNGTDNTALKGSSYNL